MLVKGIIVRQVDKIEDNNYKLLSRYDVRIPCFEAQGSNEKAILECGLIFQPGTNLGYQPDDVVVVAFENNNLNDGFILGKLYTEDSASEYTAESNPFNLKVENTAILPKSTTIGDVNVIDELTNLKIAVKALNNSDVPSPSPISPELILSDTFDSDGSFLINLLTTTLSDGLYMFTYGNTQTFGWITSSMIQGANYSPIRLPIAVIYNQIGSAQPGFLKITRVYEAILEVKVANESNHVYPGYTMYIYKVM